MDLKGQHFLTQKNCIFTVHVQSTLLLGLYLIYIYIISISELILKIFSVVYH